MKKVAIIPLAMGVLVGGLAIKLGLDTIQKAKASGQVEKVKAVVAVADIPATSEVRKEMVKVVETPTTPLLGEHSYSDVESLLGRVVLSDVPAGTLMREELLAPEGTPAGLTVRIAPGFRAVSVRIDEVTGVGYQIRPGANVDVIAVMDVAKGARKETISRIILQKVAVAAVGRSLNGQGDDDGKGKAARSVTILVRDADVPKLHLAQTRGKITLAMRGSEDETMADEKTASESELIAGALGEKPDKSPPPPPQVIAPSKPDHVVRIKNGALLETTVTFDGTTGNRRIETPSQGPSSRERSETMSVPTLAPVEEEEPAPPAPPESKAG